MERWTWDDEAKAGYVYINSDRVQHSTVDLYSDHGILVDVDPEGRIRGIEVLHAATPADMLARLAAVLERCRLVD